MLNRLMFVCVTSAALAGVGCNETETAAPPAAPAAQAAADAVPARLVLSSPPEGGRGVTEVRAAAKDGDDVVVRGVVAGRADPIAENRAIFTLLDPSMKTCDQNAGDGCQTPWDACCEPAEAIAANSATVQVVDGDGRPLKVGLGGTGGLAPLKQVVVVGTYRPSADGKAATVDATGLYVAP